MRVTAAGGCAPPSARSPLPSPTRQNQGKPPASVPRACCWERIEKGEAADVFALRGYGQSTGAVSRSRQSRSGRAVRTQPALRAGATGTSRFSPDTVPRHPARSANQSSAPPRPRPIRSARLHLGDVRRFKADSIRPGSRALCKPRRPKAHWRPRPSQPRAARRQ